MGEYVSINWKRSTRGRASAPSQFDCCQGQGGRDKQQRERVQKKNEEECRQGGGSEGWTSFVQKKKKKKRGGTGENERPSPQMIGSFID